jgi:DNA mismatch endonuclease, patch repair protein
MADVHDKETRSYNMSKIKGKDTKPEIVVRKFLHANGFRYRLHVKNLPGKPDIVLPKYRAVIFVHGCFWHGHEGCKKAELPRTKTEWWKNKIDGNVENDKKAFKSLIEQGWKVAEVWGCTLGSATKEQALNKLQAFLYSI